jgi:3-methyladenine DNA glycosylase AlkC
MSDPLSRGEVPARNLSEALSVDFSILLATLAPKKSQPDWDKGIVKRMQQAAALLGPQEAQRLSESPSDTVRGIACYAAMLDAKLSLPRRLAKLKPFAADPHFGVREWAWLAFRPYFLAEVEASIELLTPFTASKDENIRRFATESTRPRGVWCAHCDTLKRTPALALPILEPLQSDPAKYVQDSVANWLNDASKSQPSWVKSVCQRWLAASPTKATQRIATRAQRSIASKAK